MKKQGEAGFTLVELVTTLTCCAVVTLGVLSVLLMSGRIGSAAEKTAATQEAIRAAHTALEGIVSDARVRAVEVSGDDWALLGVDEGGTPLTLLRYADADGTLSAGDGTALLAELTGAEAALTEGGTLLTLTLTRGGETYPLTFYCRLGAED